MWTPDAVNNTITHLGILIAGITALIGAFTSFTITVWKLIHNNKEIVVNSQTNSQNSTSNDVVNKIINSNVNGMPAGTQVIEVKPDADIEVRKPVS